MAIRQAVWVAPLVLFLIVMPVVWADHYVGEPDLEKSTVWEECCAHRDCVPQIVVWLKRQAQFVTVAIDGQIYTIETRKIKPAPSRLIWVCYYDTAEPPINDNVRCILYPQWTPMV